jgi:predicted DNA binding protein
MGKFLKDLKSSVEKNTENSDLTEKSSFENADKSHVESEVVAESKSTTETKENSPVESNDGSRDLTDEELKTLNDSMKLGIELLKDHPWNGKDE